MNRKILAISFVALASAVSSGYGMDVENQRLGYFTGRYHRSLIDDPPLLESLLKAIRQNTVNPEFKQGIFDSWRNVKERKETYDWIIESYKTNSSSFRSDGETQIFTSDDAEVVLKWLEKETGISRGYRISKNYNIGRSHRNDTNGSDILKSIINFLNGKAELNKDFKEGIFDAWGLRPLKGWIFEKKTDTKPDFKEHNETVAWIKANTVDSEKIFKWLEDETGIETRDKTFAHYYIDSLFTIYQEAHHPFSKPSALTEMLFKSWKNSQYEQRNIQSVISSSHLLEQSVLPKDFSEVIITWLEVKTKTLRLKT